MNQKPLQQEDPTGVGGESEALGQAGNPMESTAQEMRAWSGTSPWVLVVDDEPEILEEMADLFESSGYVCKTAGSGSAALEMLKEHPEIAIMVTDLKMPGISGLELVRLAKNTISPQRRIETIVITGHAGMDEAIEALRLGAGDFLIKPVFAEKLLQAVNRASQSILHSGLKRLKEKRLETQLTSHQLERGNLTRNLKDVKSKLNHSTRELAIANRVKDEFLALVSHELRTPLATIIAVSEYLAASSSAGDDSEKEFHKMISESGHRLTQVVNTIMELVDMRSGKTLLDKQSIHLPGLIKRVLEVYGPKIDTAQLNLQYAPPENLPPLPGDPGRMAQIIGNVLDNAIKFSPAGGDVRLAVIQVNDTIEITIEDQGKGMTSEEIQFVFDAFRQVDGSATRSEYGLGLGLTLTQMYLELHGGTIAIDSVPEQGTKVTLVLPLGDG